MPPITVPDSRVDAVRRFNRFYTRQIGALEEGLLSSPYSLTAARILYELQRRERSTAAELAEALGLDAGYLSRTLRRFQQGGLLDKVPSTTDGRRTLLSLTALGQTAFAKLNAASHHEVGAMLARLSPDQQLRLIHAMEEIEGALGARSPGRVPYLLRPPMAGDMGWVIHRHGVLYAREYGWDERFEAIVAGIVAHFIQHHDPKRERCWIAERDSARVGSVFLVQKSKTVAQLRLLLVEPEARGLGIGSRLVSECVRLARQIGYRKLTLWTDDVLVAAGRIYEQSGFQLAHEETHRTFGVDLIGQIWELALSRP